MCKKFIPFREFGNIYGQTQLNKLYVMRSRGEVLPSAFSTDKKTLLVDINFFILRKELQTKVWLESHDNFYFLTRHMSASFISELLFKLDDSHSVDSWNVFLNKQLFSVLSESILAYKTEGMILKFYRYSRWLVRSLFILEKVKPQHRDISVLLDRY